MSDDFAGIYQRTFASIYGRPPEKAEGIAESDLAAAEKQLSSRLPEALRAFYSTVGGATSVTSAHNVLAPLESLRDENGSVSFCDENQSVCDWWIRTGSGDDPNVEQRMDGECFEAGACSAFLHYFMYMQALFGGLDYSGSRDVDDEVLGIVKREWNLACDHEGLAIYQKGGMLVGDMECPSLFCAARTVEDQTWLQEHFGFEF